MISNQAAGRETHRLCWDTQAKLGDLRQQLFEMQVTAYTE